MRRREFFALTGAVIAWPRAALAQQRSVPLIGFLSIRAQEEGADRVAGFQQGLKETGYVQGDNVTIEYRSAENQNARFPILAVDLVRRRVNVIVAIDSTPAAAAAKAATSTIPIVFNIGADPVEVGLVASLSRPGGNVTGVTSFAGEVAPKHLQLLYEVFPGASTVALLVSPTSQRLTESTTKQIRSMARSLGLQLQILNASTEHEVAFATLSKLRANFLVIGSDAFFTAQDERLVSLTLRQAIPAVYWTPRFTAAGGLISYGSTPGVGWHLNGVYAGRILKGERPADLPVQRHTRIRLSINLKTAKTLGITIPPTLLARADEVIE